MHTEGKETLNMKIPPTELYRRNHQGPGRSPEGGCPGDEPRYGWDARKALRCDTVTSEMENSKNAVLCAAAGAGSLALEPVTREETGPLPPSRNSLGRAGMQAVTRMVDRVRTRPARATSVVWTWVMFPFSKRSLASNMSWGFMP